MKTFGFLTKPLDSFKKKKKQPDGFIHLSNFPATFARSATAIRIQLLSHHGLGLFYRIQMLIMAQN